MKIKEYKNIKLSLIGIETGSEIDPENTDKKFEEAFNLDCNLFDIGSSYSFEGKMNNLNKNSKEIYIAKKIENVNELKNIDNQNQNKFNCIFYFDMKNRDDKNVNNICKEIKEIKNDFKWGISNAKKEKIKKCNEAHPLTFVKNNFSMINIDYEEEIEYCNTKSIFFFASSPFSGVEKEKKWIYKFEKKEEKRKEKKCKCCEDFYYYICCCCRKKSEIINCQNISLSYIKKRGLISLINLKDMNENHFKFINNNELNDKREEEINNRYKTGKNYFFRYNLLLNLTFLLLSFLQILFDILAWDIAHSSIIIKIISDDFLDNFNTGYFMNLRACSPPFASKEEDEKRRLSDNLISFGKWEGMKKGCGKNDSDDYEVKVYKEKDKCKKDETILQPISERKIFVYKGISICADTIDNYYDLLFNGSIIKEDEECPEDKKLCGYIDTIKNKLCLDNDTECPINYVSFSEAPPNNISNLKTINGSGINLYYSNDPYPDFDSIPYIINSFKISDDNICSISNLYHSNDESFILDGAKKDYAKGCVIDNYHQKYTQDFNVRYHKLHQTNAYDLYKENKIIEDLEKSDLVNYGLDTNIYKNNILNLYVRTHYGFDKECLEKRKTKFNIEQLAKIYSTADKMKTFSKYMLFNILSMIPSIYNIIESCFSNCCSEKCSCCSINPDVKLGAFLFVEFVRFIITFFQLLYSYFAIKYDDPYEDLMECSDIITNDNYNIMIYNLRKAGRYIKWIFILIIVLFVVNLFIIIFIKFLQADNKIFQQKNKNINNNVLEDKINAYKKIINTENINNEDNNKKHSESKDNLTNEN